MAVTNTLTDLIPTIFDARDTVSRELVGFIPSVDLDANAERAAKDQVIRRGYTPAVTSSALAPSMTIPNGDGQTFPNKTLTISTVENVLIPWTGEQKLSLNEAGIDRYLSQQFAQAMRTLVNKAELAVAALHVNASRAYGTAGTTPFSSGVGDTAEVLKILKDNGAPLGNLRLVMDTFAGAKLLTNTQLTKANEAGSDSLLRQGVLGSLHGFTLRESAQTKQAVTIGAGTGALFNGAGAVGDTTITYDTLTVNTTGILAGDVITITGTSGGAQKYVVATGTTSTSGTFTINAPGLRYAVADNASITVNAASTRNMAFDQMAIGLAIRPPAYGNDAAKDSMLVRDPVSGITFDVRRYAGNAMEQYHVGLACGAVAWKPEHIALLLG